MVGCIKWLVLASALALTVSCDGVGTTCDVPGTTEGCGSGLICTLTRSLEFDLAMIPVNVCLEECETSDDCGDGEVCRIVPCNETAFSCQTTPPFDFEADPDFNPCPPSDDDSGDSSDDDDSGDGSNAESSES